jgi:rSAM/selenodomain-associated transferase 2
MFVRVSLIVPVLNEERLIYPLLTSLQQIKGQSSELVIVDGGSQDNTVPLAEKFADQVVISTRGRASQMNAGAAVATGEILLFLHADTQLPHDFLSVLADGFLDSGKQWGRFDVRLSGSHVLFRIIEFFMNWRSRISGIATGDQAIFVKRGVFRQIGGYPCLALMEDISMSKLLKKISRPYCTRSAVVTSSRKWETKGILGTVLLMWRVRLAFFFGADPDDLARIYYDS